MGGVRSEASGVRSLQVRGEGEEEAESARGEEQGEEAEHVALGEEDVQEELVGKRLERNCLSARC